MPVLRPFRGLRYAAPAVTDYSAVICPPYDVISPADRVRLADRHPANAVHVELPESYDEAHRLFDAWQADGTLSRDSRELVYIYEQQYRLADGALHSARGFMCRLRLEPAGPDSGVRAHEHTMRAPKEDRFRLLSAVRANLSPVVLLYEAAPGARVAEHVADLCAAAPDVDATDDGGVRHRLWAVDPAMSDSAAALLAGAAASPLTIADGHHRYQTALRFCAEVGGSGSDEVLALLYEAGSGGLAVLAWHRLVKAPGVDVLRRASDRFEVVAAAQAEAVEPAGPGQIGVRTRQGSALLRTRLGSFGATSSALEALDVSTLAQALPALVGAGVDDLTLDGRISYTHDAAAALAAVDNGSADVAFLLAPTPAAAVIEVAAAGEVMPPKSTYFYPKAATGLVFNLLAT